MADGDRDRHPPVVVGVDPSDSARDAALWAADLAAAQGHPVEFVHVVPNRTDVRPAWLRELVDAAERTGGSPVTAGCEQGTVFDVLLTRSQRAGMVVVGSFGRDAPAGLLVGSTALTLVALAGCPVAVVRGGREGLGPPRGGPVVVGVDGTPGSDDALVLAAGLAASLGARLVAVHAWSDLEDGPEGLHRSSESWSERAASVEELLDRQLARVPLPVSVERRPVAGRPSRALLELAEEARLLVVGPHRRTPEGARRLGSTSQELVEFAPCPVVVARPNRRSR